MLAQKQVSKFVVRGKKNSIWGKFRVSLKKYPQYRKNFNPHSSQKCKVPLRKLKSLNLQQVDRPRKW